jgi:rhodanese-related sulfurtransferase
MKIVIGLLIIGVVLVGGFVLMSEPAEEKNVAGAQTEQASEFARIEQEVNANQAAMLDVRTPEEYAAGHAAIAENFSLQQLQAGQLPDIDRNTKLYVYCRSGNRSVEAATILRNAGYVNVVDLGGLGDIQALGATLVQ